MTSPGRPDDQDIRPVVLSKQTLWPQLMWRSFDDLRWVTPKTPDVPCALIGLRRAGFQRIVVSDKPVEPVMQQAADLGWRLDAASPTTGFTRATVAVGAPPDLPASCPTLAAPSPSGARPGPGPVATLGP